MISDIMGTAPYVSTLDEPDPGMLVLSEDPLNTGNPRRKLFGQPTRTLPSPIITVFYLTMSLP